jgi:hypothetical protein
MPFADAILLPLLRGRATRCGRRHWRGGHAYLPWFSSIDVRAVAVLTSPCASAFLRATAGSQLEEAEQCAVSLVLAPGAEQIVYVFCEFESVPAEGVCGAAGWKDGQTNSVGIQPLTRCNGGLGIACAHRAMPALIPFPLTTFYA